MHKTDLTNMENDNNLKIVQKNCSELIGAEYNPRELTEKQHKDLTDSLKRFGIVDPVLVNVHPDRENIIVGGHQRTRVWQELGNTTIPCVEISLTLDQEKELNIRLNKNTGQFDMDMLANHFDQEELIDWGFESFDFGLDDFHVDEVKEEVEEKDLSDDLKETFEVIIECENETELQETFDKITKEGYLCRVLTL